MQPLKQIICFFALWYFFITHFFTLTESGSSRFTLMIEPAGSSHYPGRTLDTSFESALTLRCAQELKNYLEENVKNTVRIVLSRFPGERIESLQNAQFANRLGIDLYVSIHFFEKKEERPHMFIYHFITHPVTDFWSTDTHNLAFIDQYNAHKQHISTTKKYCLKIYELFKQTLGNQVIIQKPIGFPFKPLQGINAPALGIEAQIDSTHTYQIYVKPLGNALIHIIKDIQK